MTSVYLANAKLEERAAQHLLLLDLKMEVVGEAADWLTTLAEVSISCPDILLVDVDLLCTLPDIKLKEIRKTCYYRLVIVLISSPQQAASCADTDRSTSKGGFSRHVVKRLQAIAANIPDKSG